ncbi:MAG: OmpA family protein, partial [Flavobacteriales bacterium]|nr:OmpA family protein [Flavobacteriales bacterium]
NYSKYVDVEKGQEYVLIVNNPKKANSSHKLVLHLPKEKVVVKEEEQEVEEVKQPSNLKKVIFEIKDKDTKEPLSANVDITGLRKEVIELTNVTVYETEVSKQNYEVNVVVSAKGYMLSAFDFKLFKNRSTEQEVIYVEKIKEGNKVNLKNIQFHGEKAEFLPTAAGALKSLLTFMQQNPTVKIEIEGHVNGPDQPNLKRFKTLSFDRALAVKNYLVENGIDSNRIQYIGYGNSQMLFPYPMKEEEHSANRRVEVKIVGL